MSLPSLRTCPPRRLHFPLCPSRSAPRAPSSLPKVSTFRHHSTDTTSPLPHPASSSVSQDEVSHFTKLASSWWDPHGPSRLLHLMNPLRHDFIRACRHASSEATSNTGIDYLDIGCGGGIFATSAARLPTTASVTAIDPTPSVIQVAKAKQRTDPSLREPALTYWNCAIEDLEARQREVVDSRDTKFYDIITLFEVIEHISQPAAFLSKATSHLKSGGWLVGSTIARHPVAYLTTKLVAEAPVFGVVPAGTHDWNQYINPDELKGWFVKQNADTGAEGRGDVWGDMRIQGVVYVPAAGWKLVNGSEKYGNYFFGVQKLGPA